MPIDYLSLNNNPASLINFMDDNLIITGNLKNSRLKHTPEYLELKPNPFPSEVEKDGRQIPVYKLVNSTTANSTSTGLYSYICDYTQNDIEDCRLGTDAKFCFTITMNGCTFAIGSQSGDGSCRVSHANKGGKSFVQRNMVFDSYGDDRVSMMEPALYRNLTSSVSLNATTFGISDGGYWEFHFQSYVITRGVYKAYGVFPIPANQYNG